jgi:hypothetical protein
MFSRGDIITHLVTPANYGRASGFKHDRTPTTSTEYSLANSERQWAGKIANALNLKATLLSNTSQI